MTTPKVSICIPTFQSANFLREAVESALAQSFGDFELLIGDNASTDETPAVVAAYQDSRIRYYRHAENLGYTRNVRFLLEHAGGAYAVILCADDYWASELLTPAVSLLESDESLVFVEAAYYFLREDDPELGGICQPVRLGRPPISPGKEYFFQELLVPKTILSATLFRRATALAAGSFADSSLQYLPDKEHRLRLALRGRVGCIDEPLVTYRLHPASLTWLGKSAEWFDEEIRVTRSAIALAGLEAAQAKKWEERSIRRISEEFLARLCDLKRRDVSSRDLLALVRRMWRTCKWPLASLRGAKQLVGGLLIPSSALRIWSGWRRRLASSGGG